jgi:hypothetical protein
MENKLEDNIIDLSFFEGDSKSYAFAVLFKMKHIKEKYYIDILRDKVDFVISSHKAIETISHCDPKK